MSNITEEYVDSRLQLMRVGTLYRNGYIRIDGSDANLSPEDMVMLRGEKALVSSRGTILNVQIDDDGSPSLVLSNPLSQNSSLFERSTYDRNREAIQTAAAALHKEREATSFPKTARRLKKEGFSITRLDHGQGYLIAADDKDYGSRVVTNCHLHTVLDAVTELRTDFAQLLSEHLANADYVVVDARNFQTIKRELMNDGKIDYRNQKAVRVQSITGETISVSWDKSCLGLVAKLNDRQLMVVEKDSPMHLRSLNYALTLKGLSVQKTFKGFNVYRGGVFHKPVLENLQSATEITKAVVLKDRSNGATA